MHWAACEWMDRTERQSDGRLKDELKSGVKTCRSLLHSLHNNPFLLSSPTWNIPVKPVASHTRTQTVDRCGCLQPTHEATEFSWVQMRDKHNMGGCQEQVKEYLRALRHKLAQSSTSAGSARYTTGTEVPGGTDFACRRQILFGPWSDSKESAVEGSAQRSLVTCHGLAQNPDFFIGASMGPAGWSGRTVRTCLWASTTFNTEHHH